MEEQLATLNTIIQEERAARQGLERRLEALDASLSPCKVHSFTSLCVYVRGSLSLSLSLSPSVYAHISHSSERLSSMHTSFRNIHISWPLFFAQTCHLMTNMLRQGRRLCFPEAMAHVLASLSEHAHIHIFVVAIWTKSFYFCVCIRT
jgi:hypothetical protein